MNGLIIQWGTFTSTGSTYTVNLPVAYTSKDSFTALGNYQTDTSDGGYALTKYMAVERISASSFKLGTYTSNKKVAFIAIGY